MNIEEFRNYCLEKKGASEHFPFDQTTLVMKVGSKMFALTDLEEQFEITLKCLPEKAIDLREKHKCITAGYHMNKKHWNTIVIDGSLSDKQLKAMIDDSYDLIFESLPKLMRNQIQAS